MDELGNNNELNIHILIFPNHTGFVHSQLFFTMKDFINYQHNSIAMLSICAHGISHVLSKEFTSPSIRLIFWGRAM